MSAARKVLFIDRDGSLIREPDDQQVDSLEKLRLFPGVIPALCELRDAGYRFVMVTNQDGLGTDAFPVADFETPHAAMLDIFTSQGIGFDDVLVCPHFPNAGCACRKPRLGLVRPWLTDRDVDLQSAAVIGDRQSDIELAEAMGIRGFLVGEGDLADVSSDSKVLTWGQIARELLDAPRRGKVQRKTSETEISCEVELDSDGGFTAASAEIATGIDFFDHMLEQLCRHGGFAMRLRAKGDLHVDDHHLVEDCAICIGGALRQAASDKHGIGRYGFVLPMDESLATVAVDLSARPMLRFVGEFSRERVGEFSTEMVQHFFDSFAKSLGATMHIEIKGENAHHMIEAVFKAVGRSLRQVFAKTGETGLPSSKGAL